MGYQDYNGVAAVCACIHTMYLHHPSSGSSGSLSYSQPEPTSAFLQISNINVVFLSLLIHKPPAGPGTLRGTVRVIAPMMDNNSNCGK